MSVTDIRAMKKLADEHGLLLIADNTFLSPYFQNPLDLGADLVIHSGTKFLNGHNDVLASLSEDLKNRTIVCTAPTKTFNLAAAFLSGKRLPLYPAFAFYFYTFASLSVLT